MSPWRAGHAVQVIDVPAVNREQRLHVADGQPMTNKRQIHMNATANASLANHATISLMSDISRAEFLSRVEGKLTPTATDLSEAIAHIRSLEAQRDYLAAVAIETRNVVNLSELGHSELDESMRDAIARAAGESFTAI